MRRASRTSAEGPPNQGAGKADTGADGEPARRSTRTVRKPTRSGLSGRKLPIPRKTDLTWQSEGELPQTMSTDFVTFIGTVDSSSDNHFALNLDSPNWYWPQGEELLPKPNLSGASGGPCVLIFPDENPIEFAGVIYQGQSDFEIVRARQANLIGAKGKIKPGF